MHKDSRNKVPQTVREKVLADANFTCVYCFAPATQVDHIIPRSYNVDYDESNLVASCQLCNGMLGNKVFPDLASKQQYIRKKLQKLMESKVVGIWLQEEFDELGSSLKRRMKDKVVMVESEEERQRTIELLKNMNIRAN